MDHILDIDINEVVTEQVTEQIKSLENSLEEAHGTIRKLRTANGELKKTVALTGELSELLTVLRTRYARIKSDEPDSGGWYDNQQKKRYQFIVKLMKMIYGIETEQKWLSLRGAGKLKAYLAVTFYDHKGEITQLVKVLSPGYVEINNFIERFVMPRDYEKQAVISYVEKPHYCTNGAVFGISQYWLENMAGWSNLPHNLIMQNPYIVVDDVFSALVDTIKSKRANFHYLFALPEYNDQLSDDQIAALGECLIDNVALLKYDCVESFVRDNMEKLNKTTLDYLYNMIDNKNHFRVLHWENFPVEYQRKFISGLSAADALSAVSSYSCKLSPEDKISLLTGGRA